MVRNSAKNLGVHYNVRIAKIAGLPLKFLVILLIPLVALTEMLNRPFGKKKTANAQNDTIDESGYLIRFAALKTISAPVRKKSLRAA